MQSELLALAEKVEQATGPDRELDAAVWLHLPEQNGHAWKHDGDRYKHARQIAGVHYVPRYTASLDAAMTLAPEGEWFVTLVRDPSGMSYAGVGYQPGDTGRPALSPALALTAAALRARAAQHDQEVG